jgi:hypothetical protein
MNKEQIVKEYDARFKKKPNKWTSDERNEFCYQTLLHAIPTKNNHRYRMRQRHTVTYLPSDLRTQKLRDWIHLRKL